MRNSVLGFATLLMNGCVGQLSVQDERIELAAPFHAVMVSVESGHVTLTGGDIGGALIDRSVSWSGRAPDMEARIENGVLRLVATCADAQSACAVDHVATIPRDVSVEVVTGAGDVEIRDIRGEVVVGTGGGAAFGRELSADRVIVTTLGGSIDVWVTAAPEWLELSSADGDVSVVVPSEAYDIEANAPSGHVQVSGVEEHPAANRQLQLRTEQGNIRVEGR